MKIENTNHSKFIDKSSGISIGVFYEERSVEGAHFEYVWLGPSSLNLRETRVCKHAIILAQCGRQKRKHPYSRAHFNLDSLGAATIPILQNTQTVPQVQNVKETDSLNG